MVNEVNKMAQAQPYMQLAGAGGVPVYDNSNIMKFQNVGLKNQSSTAGPSAMQGAADMTRVNKSASSRADVKMYAGP